MATPTVIEKPLAFHLHLTDVRALRPCRHSGAPLPDSLVIEPGIYRVHDQVYDCRREGLYRFIHPWIDNQQRVVYRKDRVGLLSSLSWIVSHGTRDQSLTHDQQVTLAKQGKLIVTCGHAAQFAVTLLRQLDLPARRIGVSQVSQRNTYDCGHQLMEAQLAGRWTLVDLDAKQLFAPLPRRGRKPGPPLSAAEFLSVARSGDYQLQPLSNAVFAVIGGFRERDYSFDLLMETQFHSTAALRQWYARLTECLYCYEAGVTWTTAPTPTALRQARKLYAADASRRYLKLDEYTQQLYGQA